MTLAPCKRFKYKKRGLKKKRKLRRRYLRLYNIQANDTVSKMIRYNYFYKNNYYYYKNNLLTSKTKTKKKPNNCWNKIQTFLISWFYRH